MSKRQTVLRIVESHTARGDLTSSESIDYQSKALLVGFDLERDSMNSIVWRFAALFDKMLHCVRNERTKPKP